MPRNLGGLLPRHRPRSSAPRCSQTVSVWSLGERMVGAGRPIGTGLLVGYTGVTRPRRSGYHGFLVDNEGVARAGDSRCPDRTRPLNARCPPWELASSAPFCAQNSLSFAAFGLHRMPRNVRVAKPSGESPGGAATRGSRCRRDACASAPVSACHRRGASPLHV